MTTVASRLLYFLRPKCDEAFRCAAIRHRDGAFFILLVLFLFFGNARAGATQLVFIDNAQPQHSLGKDLKYLEDKSGELTLEDILADNHQSTWFSDDSARANLGFSESAFWIKGRLLFGSRESHVQAVQRWLMIEYVLLDYIDIYVMPAGQKMSHYELGDLRSFENQRFNTALPVVPVQLSRGDVTEFYIRVKTGSANLLGVSLHSFESLTDTISEKRLKNGLFYGVMIIMVLYNLFLFFSVSDKTYLYYVLGIASFTLTAAALDGVPWQYDVFKDKHWNNQIIPLLISSTWICLTQFSRSFLNVRDKAPMIDGLLRFMAIAFVWSSCLSFILDYSFMVQLNSQLTLLYAIVLSAVGLIVWRRGHRPARYYVVAWTAYMIGVLSQVLYVLGSIPYSEFVENGARWGGFANVLLLSLALADRINTQKRETENARQRALESKKEAELARADALTNLKRFKNLFDNAAEGIFRCNPEGRFINLNPAFAHIFGYRSADEMMEEVTDTKNQCYKNPADYEALEKVMARIGRISNIEAEYLRKDGSSFWCTSSANLVRDENGKPQYFEGFLIDITEKKEKEAALREREAAQASAQAKSEFLANMSHEIRTPMNAIIGFAALTHKTNLNNKQRDYISKIESSSKNLLGIVNDILDFSKIEAGKMDLENLEFSFNDVINDVVGMLSHKAAEKSLELVVSINPGVPPRLLGDPLRLEQILINLANNAIKFTEQGEVIIRVFDVSELDGKTQLEFSVEDTGIGITREQQEKLFKPFSQADGSTTRKYGGTGLGLTISKQLVELMDGEIWVTSEQNKGSQFRFNAWFGKPAVREGMPSSIYESTELKGMRVLLIDDKDSGQEALIEILTSFECQARWIQPDYTLIDSLKQDVIEVAYDLVVIDRQLAAMSSLEAASGIRALEFFKDVPIVVMALNSEETLISSIHEQGFVCMIKPVTPSVMLDCIQDIFGYTGPRASRRSPAENDERVLNTIRGARVLLVEDTPFNQEIAIEFLNQVEVDVILANNGVEALDILADENFDAIIMDCQMPEMDGFEATRRIRHQMGLVDVPIIAMTANAMKGDKMKCLKAGMSDYISKPVAQTKLYSTLAHWLGAKVDHDPEFIDPEFKETESIKPEFVEPEQLDSVESESLIDYTEVVETDLQGLADNLDDAIRKAQSHQSNSPLSADSNATSDEQPAFTIPIVEPELLTEQAEAEESASYEENAFSEGQTDSADKASMDDPCDATEDVIDLDEALKNMGGSEDLLYRMLRKFREDQAESLNNIIDYYDAGDKTTAHRLAHTLKGIAASISAHELRFNMAELEQALEMGAIDTRIEQLFCEADNAFKQVIASIDNLQKEP